jgi:hypothetical protein
MNNRFASIFLGFCIAFLSINAYAQDIYIPGTEPAPTSTINTGNGVFLGKYIGVIIHLNSEGTEVDVASRFNAQVQQTDNSNSYRLTLTEDEKTSSDWFEKKAQSGIAYLNPTSNQQLLAKFDYRKQQFEFEVYQCERTTPNDFNCSKMPIAFGYFRRDVDPEKTGCYITEKSASRCIDNMTWGAECMYGENPDYKPGAVKTEVCPQGSSK